MSANQKMNVFSSKEFLNKLISSTVSRHPDIYYVQPFTKEYQHMFHVVENEPIMRPSFLKQDNSASVVVHCQITQNFDSNKTEVLWSGNYIQKN